jgi:hypothetical protein
MLSILSAPEYGARSRRSVACRTTRGCVLEPLDIAPLGRDPQVGTLDKEGEPSDATYARWHQRGNTGGREGP